MATSPNKLPPSSLAQPVTTLWGVGAERAAQLARLNINTIEDLLLHRPRRYEDRRHFQAIQELTTRDPALTRGTVVAKGLKRFRRGGKSVFELVLSDASGRLHCRWWNLPFMEKYFDVGDEVVVFGKLVGLKPRTMDHPETEVIESGEELQHFGSHHPDVSATEGLPQRWLRVDLAHLERYEKDIPEPPYPCGPTKEIGVRNRTARHSPVVLRPSGALVAFSNGGGRRSARRRLALMNLWNCNNGCRPASGLKPRPSPCHAGRKTGSSNRFSPGWVLPHRRANPGVADPARL